MKRSNVLPPPLESGSPTSGRARARVSPLSPDTLLALLDAAAVTAGQLLAGSADVASRTSDMVVHNAISIKQASTKVAAVRAAHVTTTKRVVCCARRSARSSIKSADSWTEVLSVTAKQLRALGSIAASSVLVSTVHEAVSAGCSVIVIAFQPVMQVWDVVPVCLGVSQWSRVGRVVTGDGLRVVRASGLGLKWFKPDSRNELSVVLAHADGSLPLWLSSADVAAAACSTAGFAVHSSGVPAETAVRLEVDQCVVDVAYVWAAREDSPSVFLQLTVCGVPVTASSGTGDWGALALPKPLAGHQFAAVGTHVATLTIVKDVKDSMAVSADEKWLVVGLKDKGALFVYSLPAAELVRTFGGGTGDRPLQFNRITQMCFALNGHLIVADSKNNRLQEVTLEGAFVRFIGVGEFFDGNPHSVDVYDDVIAVGCSGGTGLRVVLFDFDTGAVTSRFGEMGTATSRFGEMGTAPGKLSRCCRSIRFTPDGSHLIIAEFEALRLSLFSTSGVLVRCVSTGLLSEVVFDVVQAVTGEYVVSDFYNHSVVALSPVGSILMEGSRFFRGKTKVGGLLRYPMSMAAAGRHLYVINESKGKVLVFE